MEACEGCGFAWADVPVEDFGRHLVSLEAAYRDRLTAHPDGLLRQRPLPDVWSPLEYACHVRDMLLVNRERIYLALVEVRPSFARMYREERVGLARYAAESPAGLADQVGLAFELVRVALSERRERDWARLLLYNFPEPQEHDVAWLGRHTLHECVHHLADIDAGLLGA